MCAKQAGASQALETKGKTAASTKYRQAQGWHKARHRPPTLPQAGIVLPLTTASLRKNLRRQGLRIFFTNFVEKIVSKRLDLYQSD
jgi:hypothetical protein